MKILLHLNSAITEGTNPDGTWCQADRNVASPLLMLVMRLDGVAAVYVKRYYIEVEYLDDITTPAAITKVVQDAIDKLLDEGTDENNRLFPLRGDKKPTVTLDKESEPRPNYLRTVVARFNSDLVAFSKVKVTWEKMRTELGERLGYMNGIRDYQVTLRTISLTFDTRATTEESVKEHISTVLNDTRKIKAIFPFLTDDQVLELTFEV